MDTQTEKEIDGLRSRVEMLEMKVQSQISVIEKYSTVIQTVVEIRSTSCGIWATRA